MAKSDAKVSQGKRNSAPNAINNVKTRRYSLWNFWICATVLKVLLFPGYYSTDFDVHRNWLAITNKLPLNKWYVESTSQWTLDYPPFFAYFEWFLSQFVPKSVAEDGCLDIVKVGSFGLPTIIFQRITVILSELVLYAALQVFINTSDISEKSANFVVASSIVLSPGLLIVDHIHFQYNGFLFGILISSIVAAKNKRYILCAAFFSIALCFKHIFLYLAPAYFVFLLRAYVLDFSSFKFRSYKDLISIVQWSNLLKLASVVMGIFSLAFLPFITTWQQLLARLFPFSRGLTHAYWAPNVWAVYSFTDKVLTVLVLKLPYLQKILSIVLTSMPKTAADIHVRIESNNSGTRGLVQDVFFVVLPQITPKLTFLLTLFYQILAVVPVLFDPSFKRFVGSLTLCGFVSFLFGWHVHEKAIMLVIFPFSFLVPFDRRLLTPFTLLASAGYVSLFPLLYESQDFLLKFLYTFIWCILYFYAMGQTSKVNRSGVRRIFFFDRLAICYYLLLIPMVLFVQALDVLKHKYAALDKYEFLGLMIYSIYCSIGVLSSWIGLSWLFNFDEPMWN
ncbi:dolichyl-P-Glc:Glc1Man(9)GlcNAc(2)-PP-dolichol alpha-1,3-glucosyltransferase [Kluyveromyces lactis]|uniref:Dolichyl pyrophosphate Glc1Man9GlcNAc2 alpha-1,3-glucosyltransferase n=1 Tax=Kluyveromyces lactis (strain ATCC 8585 / CBS 2359 / DSM 70799 / NBRC 1267 / NRRL Y-1140 / WM37) TaxID=284590 RepID=ALG8_KLULA|nr:uncharacterized protein KLLA0_F16621g [Kluyveromyces lactis]Q6CJR2.1 RecName: Full=Dolichyl pyrophosphate Glc1Man9GlcNAc2 alpha-1,3-glucosyltransferase; AltName: Full=Asparagine-linked glycosylation protein 8; AltName: Full=Dol-P-Glc:Glc(1)Man(9)GlcNAc(2)-PP-dolichyl alpha-1,3-glucosyltransferase; AltName: Full=Dolichyl-P-Glc:Glc1Man9GlcNAc2-PP-dolichyl glucosyltransferase [Kluyveromyces lactis NRRL Y-1140]CAG98535.1 KLLA0F16621p [Kluyveromyces lactis]|eukprot:XP_455827.1 uncharacterized protein KLLA0_F16621g [Kluyveromyces lactis]